MSARPFLEPFAETWAWAQANKLILHSVEETESTNDIGKSSEFLTYPALVIARTQTKGRGRHDRTWCSTPGALLSSWVFKPTQAPQPILSPLAGLALYDAARSAFPNLPFGLKAPNDLYLGDKKVAGLLIESVITGKNVKLVIGLGLNVMNPAPDVPTSTAIAHHTEIQRSNWFRFLEALRANLTSAVNDSLNLRMPLETCEKLAHALNVCAVSKELVISVTPRGDLVTKSGTQPWYEL